MGFGVRGREPRSRRGVGCILGGLSIGGERRRVERVLTINRFEKRHSGRGDPEVEKTDAKVQFGGHFGKWSWAWRQGWE